MVTDVAVEIVMDMPYIFWDEKWNDKHTEFCLC